MIGAKEFAIGRKIIEKKKINPLLEKITMPKLSGLGAEKLEGLDEAFDKDKKNILPFNLPILKSVDKIDTSLKRTPDVYTGYLQKSKNPILERVIAPKEAGDIEEEFKKSFDNFAGQEKSTDIESSRIRAIPKVELSKKIDANTDAIKEILGILKTSKNEISAPKRKEGEFSEDMMNRLTRRVLENIRGYLNDGYNPNRAIGGKQVKIELNL